MITSFTAGFCRRLMGLPALAGGALMFAGLFFLPFFFDSARAQQQASDSTAPAPAKAPADAKKVATNKLVCRFEPCVFSTKEFPARSLQNEEMVQSALGPVRVETTFYNEKFEEVKEAAAPGRYGAVVRITLGDGTVVNRFITLYRTVDNVQWKTISGKLKIPAKTGNTPEALLQQQDAIGTVLKDAMGDSGFSPQVAKVLFGLALAAPDVRPEALLFNFMARDDAWWFDLRQRIGLAETYPFLIELPAGYGTDPARRWPLILSLHGSGERGNFLPNLKRSGLAKRIATGHKLDAIVVSPQCPANQMWSSPVLSRLIDDVSAKYQVDPDRVIVTGLSMGGFGTWALAMAYPERFAAIVPICGGNNPADAARLKNLPIWAFHGQLDPTVPVMLSQTLTAAIRQAGGAPHLTIYPDVRHDSWTKAYETEALYTWMLAQQRGKPEVKTAGLQEP